MKQEPQDSRHNMRKMYAQAMRDQKEDQQEITEEIYKQELEHFTYWYNNVQNKSADIIFAHFKKYFGNTLPILPV